MIRGGCRSEALDARIEAVGVYREMAARDPGLYEATYREKLGALRREYERRGMRYEAVTHGLGDPALDEEGDRGETAPFVRDE
ncbi:hypothetical protein [Trebonia sp.]|uniref:hypothetical protein n=1 Tax=Trebonia sp. TaxID=2767075 RepID=UPI0026121318|nr:hypothetical protein [Trebonia sp.]